LGDSKFVESLKTVHARLIARQATQVQAKLTKNLTKLFEVDRG